MAHSARSLPSVKGPPSSRPRDQESRQGRTQRDKDNHWERRHEADHPHRGSESYRSDRGDHKERKPHPSNGRSSTQSPPYSQHSKPPTVRSEPCLKSPFSSTHMYGSPSRSMRPEKQSFSEKCSNLCSRRGILQFVEIVVNILVLICVVASFAVTSGFTSSAGLGTGSMSLDAAYNPFEGTEFQEARQLDMQYSQLRAPGVYGGVAFSLAVGAITIGFLIVGAKPFHNLSIRILMAELVFEALACAGYIIAVALYLHFITVVNATDLCKKREILYSRRGYTWMNCEVQGGDAAVAIFGLIASCLYLPSAVLCGLTIKSVREYRRNLPPEDYIASSFRERDYNMYKSSEDPAEITLV
ncbi:MARVEL domain-containing protein 3-like isoform X2 [Ambystoma mexicanum]|uniref:MARVEL domain-containing protein 3-like isoform X2 n=1 Tax=Ambystoma mexicanum TaxID=8296 RepID=UPI0037E75CCE